MLIMNIKRSAKSLVLTCACALLPATSHAEVRGAVFTSTDTALCQAYDWARRMALSYAHDGADPVGPWYEAALPGREAFCMRDVSHQAIGAQLLGLARHNKNMMSRFVSNVSGQRDWCSFWEINRYDKPCPADYVSDSSFWYNLNANFDVLVSCLHLYHWTGDSDYVAAKRFRHFYDVTTHEYVDRWRLRPAQLKDRPVTLNERLPATRPDPFRARRGIPSYTEGIAGLTMSADLVAVMSAAFRSYADICQLDGGNAQATQAREEAARYRKLLDDKWWNGDKSAYMMLLDDHGHLSSQQGIEFLLRYGVVSDSVRIASCLAHFETRPSAIEMVSYQPLLLFEYGRPAEAECLVTALPRMARASYPEVSYAIIEGLGCGLMGLQPDITARTLHTAFRGSGEATAELRDIPLWDGTVSVKHWGHRASRLHNATGYTLHWRARFKGRHASLLVDGKRRKASAYVDALRQTWTELTVEVPVNQSVTILSQP